MPGDLARRALTGTRFADVRWVAETGSTNADAMALARAGAPEGLVIVADHQTAGRGRRGRTWEAPSGAALLVSVLLRPPSEVAGLVTMAVSVAACWAASDVCGVLPQIKWPNDLVFTGDAEKANRKLAGILAETDWSSSGEVAVVVGMGVNVTWHEGFPEEIRTVAVALNEYVGADVDREELLIAFLRRLDDLYGRLIEGRDVPSLLSAYRERSVTLGSRVRVDLGTGDVVVGMAAGFTAHGHLIVEDDDGGRRTIAVGDVVHLRVP